MSQSASSARRRSASRAESVGQVLACSLRPMGGAFTEELPTGWLDFAREVPPQPDALIDVIAVGPDDAALVVADCAVDARRLDRTGRPDRRGVGLGSGGRLITDANPTRPSGLAAALLAPIVVGASVVLVTNCDAEQRAAIGEQERVDRAASGSPANLPRPTYRTERIVHDLARHRRRRATSARTSSAHFGNADVDVVVLDSLASGVTELRAERRPAGESELLDVEIVRNTIVEHDVVGVVHLAGFKYAGVSVDKPLLTYEQNVTGTVKLLQAMQETGVDKIVFSSSAATFGTPDVDLVTEETPTAPESPYGESKLIGEWLLRDQERATGLKHTSLRYFNVVGSAEPHLYDTSPHNLFPKVLDDAVGGHDPADQRRRLPDTRRHLRARLPARRRSGRDASRRCQGAGGRPPARTGLQPRKRPGCVGPRDHDHDRRGDRHRLRAGRSRPVAGAIQRGSSPPESWPLATSAGP